MNHIRRLTLSFCLILPGGICALGGLPPDFPAITTHLYNPSAVSPGSVLLATCPNANVLAGAPTYIMVLNNDGSPVAYKQIGFQKPGDFYGADFKLLSDGTLFYQQFMSFLTYTGGGNTYGVQVDDQLNEIGRFQMGNGYVAESHDFQLLSNGHALMMGYYTTFRDLSAVVSGGYPRAEVSGAVVQELDSKRQVVWQWRSWDHFKNNEYFWGTTSGGNLVSAWHENVLRPDDDGDLFVGTVQEIMKVSRQTGEVRWRLGGPFNQFKFVGVSQQEGVFAFLGHDFHRLPNGNVLLYNNTAPGRPSRAQEYKLDEKNKVATYVWSWVPTNNISAVARGSAERLPNGNTFIGWGTSLTPGYTGPDVTEVAPDGSKVWELQFNDPTVDSYRAFRIPFPTSAQHTSVLIPEITDGGHYVFSDSNGDTGVTMDVDRQVSQGYNSLTVARQPYSPLVPEFVGKAPQLLPVRVRLTPVGMQGISATLGFNVTAFQIKTPASMTVYFRPYPGQGLFVPLSTTYNFATGQILAPTTDFGEFALGFPDIAEIPYPPILGAPDVLSTNQFVTRVTDAVEVGKTYSVNQMLPISLTWSPKGFAASYHFQLSQDAGFGSNIIDADGLIEARFAITNAAPGTTYYWRVNTSNDGGTSDWASSSFATVPPSISVTFPSNGVALQRGISYFIQWEDNTPENVVLDLYKAGVFVKNIKTVPSVVAFKWQADLTAAPGNDYSIKVSSANNPSVSGISTGTFSLIDPPVIDRASVVRHADGSLQFFVSAVGVPTATVVASTDLKHWTPLQTLTLTNNSAVFSDNSAASFPGRVYRVQVP